MKRKRIVVSQRLDSVPGRDEFRDGLDVRITALLWDLGFLPLPLSAGVSNQGAYIQEIAPDGVVLSGGNDIGQAKARDALEVAVLQYAKENQVPVLGICRGMQMLNHFQGGTMRPMKNHTAVRHQVAGPLVGKDHFEVNSYHDFAMLAEDLGDELEAVAWSKDGVIEAVRHKNLPWLGIMWHPERDAPFANSDNQLILNHLWEDK